MPQQNDRLNFQLEVSCNGTSREMMQIALMVRDAPEASMCERMLAQVVIHQAAVINDLVAALSTGSVRLTVFEDDIRHIKRG